MPTVVATAVPARTAAAGISTASAAIFISDSSIFFPRYSGVRPTMSPAIKTAMTAYMSIPNSPAPTPPKIVSSHIILISGTAPPSGV